MPYREIQQQTEQCSICGRVSAQRCRRCGDPVCREHTSDPEVRGVCLQCVGELEERIAEVTQNHEHAKAARLRALVAPPGPFLERKREFFGELRMEVIHSRRLRRLLRCFERETPHHLERLQDFKRRRVTVGICITCGEPARQSCHRCNTAMCEAHSEDQAFNRCSRCERDFREEVGVESDWIWHPLRALGYLRRRSHFLEQHYWDPEVYGG